MRLLISLRGVLRAPIHRIGSAAVLVSIMFGTCERAAATPIASLFNTGVDGAKIALPAGSVDAHYKLIYSDDPGSPVPTSHVSASIPASWIGNTGSSHWIQPGSAATGQSTPSTAPAGTYMYELTFDLGGASPTAVSITGNWAAADVGLIELNGTFVAGTLNPSGPGVLTPFTIPTGSGFVAGSNRLDFVVISSGAAQPGIQVTFTPEPSTAALVVLAIASLLCRRAWTRRGLTGARAA